MAFPPVDLPAANFTADLCGVALAAILFFGRHFPDQARNADDDTRR
jgi:hypothetical protein